MHIVATTDDERLKYPGRVKSKMKLIVKSVHSLFLYHGSLCACTSMSLCNHCGVVYSPFMFHLFIRSLLSPRLVVVFVLLWICALVLLLISKCSSCCVLFLCFLQSFLVVVCCSCVYMHSCAIYNSPCPTVAMIISAEKVPLLLWV